VVRRSAQVGKHTDCAVLFLDGAERRRKELGDTGVGEPLDVAGDSVFVSGDDDVLRPGYTLTVEDRAVFGYLTGQSELFSDAM
jgi:hypothetical protein